MNVFVAGASGAIGRPLVAELVRRGHTVTGMTRSDAGAKALADLGAAVARVSAFDAERLEQALRESRAEVVIDELTALPAEPGPRWPRPRRATGSCGSRAAGTCIAPRRACGVRRYIQQASGFFLRPGPGLGDESEGMAVDASPRVASHARTYAELEARVLDAEAIEGVALRYGFFYGPGTWYHPDGASADQVRQGRGPDHRRGRGRLVVGPHRRRGRRHRRRADGPARGVPRRRRRPVPGVSLAAGVRPVRRGSASAADHGRAGPGGRGRGRGVLRDAGCEGRRTPRRRGCSGSAPAGWSG